MLCSSFFLIDLIKEALPVTIPLYRPVPILCMSRVNTSILSYSSSYIEWVGSWADLGAYCMY